MKEFHEALKKAVPSKQYDAQLAPITVYENRNIVAQIAYMPEEIVLHELEAKIVGKGHASRFMRDLTRIADKLQVRLSLFAYPFDIGDKKRLSKKDLVAFYRRHGFKGDGDMFMREPSAAR